METTAELWSFEEWVQGPPPATERVENIWEAPGIPCRRCRRESFQLTLGFCSSCARAIAAEGAAITEETVEKEKERRRKLRFPLRIRGSTYSLRRR